MSRSPSPSLTGVSLLLVLIGEDSTESARLEGEEFEAYSANLLERTWLAQTLRPPLLVISILESLIFLDPKLVMDHSPSSVAADNNLLCNILLCEGELKASPSPKAPTFSLSGSGKTLSSLCRRLLG